MPICLESILSILETSFSRFTQLWKHFTYSLDASDSFKFMQSAAQFLKGATQSLT